MQRIAGWLSCLSTALSLQPKSQMTVSDGWTHKLLGSSSGACGSASGSAIQLKNLCRITVLVAHPPTACMRKGWGGGYPTRYVENFISVRWSSSQTISGENVCSSDGIGLFFFEPRVFSTKNVRVIHFCWVWKLLLAPQKHFLFLSGIDYATWGQIWAWVS